MDREAIVNRIGAEYHTVNVEHEWSYIADAGNKETLLTRLGDAAYNKILSLGDGALHFLLDIRFVCGNTAILIETKQKATEADSKQLACYCMEEHALHPEHNVVGILADIQGDHISVWKNQIDDAHFLKDETALQKIAHYASLFSAPIQQNNRQEVLKNTYKLNEMLHKSGIDEKLRSQFVGSCLLFIKDYVDQNGNGAGITDELVEKFNGYLKQAKAAGIRAGIKATLDEILDGSSNKEKKVELLQKNVLSDQHVKELMITDWITILDFIMTGIYRYIDASTSEGQDILNLFFITFNKYVGKADKNQAFTPDHITHFMCKATGVTRTTRVFDGTCGSGSFLVQAMVQELYDCKNLGDPDKIQEAQDNVKKKNIWGCEVEETAFGLAVTNCLIHGDGNSNVKLGDLFKNEAFVAQAAPSICLMNPPYNSKPRGIPEEYKKAWGKAADGKEDPTKGMVFVKFLSDVAKRRNWQGTKLAVLLPMSAAIGSSSILTDMKTQLLQDNTLEAVFSLPNEIFYPGASVQACCMIFTLNQSHFDANGKPRKKTFFGYYREDGFKKKKNLGRVEQFDADGNSIWKQIEQEWLELYFNNEVKPGLSATHYITGDDEWLAETYMETDYSKLTQADFQKTVNDYLAYLVKTGKVAG